jgi:hypothetical protein
MVVAPDGGLRDGRRAVQLATRANELSRWDYPATLEVLAAAYDEAGDFTAAVQWQQKAIARYNDAAATSLAEERLKQYLRQKTVRDPTPQQQAVRMALPQVQAKE